MFTKYLKESDAAAYMAVNQQTVARLRKKGLLRAVKLDRSWVYSASEIDRFFGQYMDCDLSRKTKIERKVQ